MPPRKRASTKVVAAGTPVMPTKPKRTTGGNTRGDVAWIAAQREAGALLDVMEGEKPPEFLYEVTLRWTSLQEDLDPGFFEPFATKNGRRCSGPAYIRDERGGYVVDLDWERLRRPCLGAPALGANVCHKHGAQLGHVKRAALQRLAEASDPVAARLITMTGLRDELGSLIEHKDRINAMIQVLERAGIKAGAAEGESDSPKYREILEELFGEDKTDGKD